MSEQPVYALGSICHIEIPAPDLPRLGAFYAEVFGWTITPMMEGYHIFQCPGGANSGGLDASQKPAGGGGVVPVLKVDEVTAALERIRAAGGTPLTGKMEIGGDHGFCAYFHDPCGNRMGVWSKT